MKKKLILPKFKNEDEERGFWSNIDLTDYFEQEDFVPVSFPNLQLTTKAISLRVPKYLITQIKEKANSMDVPYQALMKKYIADGIRRDLATDKIK
ncbi:MAG: hypothetical protein A3C85_03715 [Candidatus Doudnabacteria bacterium RIFCSPHIGHO2_02_FULL_48_21]|uniref:CopG family transcriptional regulator n=1 Tax=Candidatus Doudnabacteria bacterium RIFCSPLOWO2_02_FULL_48_13 TaxID=1817845 RepID=A0A1F5QBV8_9BACT|nr:MAG: hypothetical protein A3K05_03210 [Candidatus Doudnabacteria bacterium RIFCSPHIGHO2_01_48_18]OGE79616.1 MAG: hypothetical protein A2668_01330 [Candidatus Doudnabacteria bacterium RIFCSPHIGHO2_01_FULL_48_180]OGE91751.1 MAG: hypothetical protein A3F44_00055 [Candidatus Doudnabacteria bacterium RIFCSPHIGHO2_12_FULL_47_25]OGE93564.1 MAG: hypothetical protein A3C85_03715 [Candidatus Doudnabacteria bacterium RIFCSPHIGHO2_02_FULL_48_21]OGE96329.1 MAG: hypothetical protein A3A83_00170 [Candidatu